MRIGTSSCVRPLAAGDPHPARRTASVAPVDPVAGMVTVMVNEPIGPAGLVASVTVGRVGASRTTVTAAPGVQPEPEIV